MKPTWEMLRDLREKAYREPKAHLTATTLKASLDLGSLRCQTNEETLVLAVEHLFQLSATLELQLYKAAALAPPPVYIVITVEEMEKAGIKP